MAKEEFMRKCEDCGYAIDTNGDAMVWCKHLGIRVCKCSVACPAWSYEKIF